MNRLVWVALSLMLSVLMTPLCADAVDAPHFGGTSGFTCATCHTAQLTLGTTGYNNICLNCHRSGDPAAGKKPFTSADASNVYGNHSPTGTKLYQTSHRWDGPDIVPAAGALPPIQAALTSNNLRGRTGNALACVRCHDQHSNTNGKFLRVANDQDQLCLDCHRSRNVQSHLQGSHPVKINYNSAPGSFNKPPLNSNPANPTSDLNARLAASGGNLLCSTCHGVHYTDSRSSTVDGSANFTTISSSNGFLLRTDMRGAKITSGLPDKSNICTNCHAGKKNHNQAGQDIQCIDCHGAHVEFDPNDPTASKGTNVFLIRRNIINKATGQPSQIYFRYTGSKREYKNAQGTGVCQGCHAVPAAGTFNAPPEHASTDPKVCNSCHFHNSPIGSFSGACTSCHGYPPTTATIGGPTGLATPATGATAANPGAHATHAKGRLMACTTCHNGFTSKTMPSNSIDIGFSINGGNFPGFGGSVTTGTYITTTPLAAPYTFSGSVSSTGTNQTCVNIYCHGATLSGGTSTTPLWTGTNQAACGTCHGVTPATALSSGSHLRHAGSSSAGLLALACSTCHGATTDNTHINGSVKWDLSALGGAAGYKTPAGAYAPTGSTGTIAPSAAYGQCTNIYCHSNVQGIFGSGAPTVYSQPVWGGSTLGCAGCHADMATDATGTGSHRVHTISTGANFDCAVCHAGYTKTSTAPATHANRLIELGATGVTYSQGTAHAPGSGYGTCSASTCHGSATVPWGGTLWSATDQCGKCHASNAAGAITVASPFHGTSFPTRVSAATDAKVGAHTAHVASIDSISAAIDCAGCHGSVTLKGATHMNGTTNFVWNALATKNGALTPTYTAATGTCANVYCHGAAMPGGDTSGTNRVPVWNSNTYLPSTLSAAACGTCHGFPPSTASGHPSIIIPAGFPASASISTTCSCHSNINPAGNSYANIFVNIALHINGTLDVSAGGACDSCHGYPPAGAGFVGTHGNWSSAKVENYLGGGGAHTILNHISKLAKPSEGFANCSNCHSATDHQMSPIAFNPSKNIKVSGNQRNRFVAAKQFKYSSNRLDGNSHVTGSCSNGSCHFGATPKWDPKH
ncbi:MAG: CxxxxCH/CxxCH domain-containing protein [Desulfuromonadales bacterium]|nr:CxxxxCH/CxxCH domain-containing protein [Desulfuromonadales bacterium]